MRSWVIVFAIMCGAGCATAPALNPRVCLPVERKAHDLTAQFLGTSSVLIDDGQTAILTDGFFSRPSALRVSAIPLAPSSERIDRALTQARISRLDALFVAHAHYDHALDSGTVANRTCARLYGSTSTLNLLDDTQRRAIDPLAAGGVYGFATMSVTAFATPHSQPVRYPGSIAEPLSLPAPVRAMREGGNFSFLIAHAERRILIVTSANFSPGMFSGQSADVVFLSVGGLGARSEEMTRAYWRETVEAVGARLVIPIHWDNFTRPLEQGLRPLPRPFDNYNLTRERLYALAARSGVTILQPAAFQPINLSARSALLAPRADCGSCSSQRAAAPVGVAQR